jgi:autotransporter-associated beta strand protein
MNKLTLNPGHHLKTTSGQRSTAFRRLLGVGIAVLLFQTAQAVVTLPFYEPFPTTYNEGEQLGAGAFVSGTIWTNGNSVSSSSAIIRTFAGMSYPGLQTTAGSRGLASGSGTGKNRGVAFSALTNNAVYASFLFNLTNNSPADRLFACLSSDLSTTPNVNAGVYMDSSARLRIAKNAAIAAITLPTSPTTYALVPDNTYLVVLRYTFNAAGTSNDVVDLWLDPTSLGNNNVIPAPTLSVTNGTDVTSFQSFYYLRSSAGLNAAVPFWMDEIRVSTNWADVTPTNCFPGATFNVTGGGSICSGPGFPVGLSGSEVGVDYWLYTNGVFTATVVSGSGSAIDFGIQTTTALYAVLGSNTVSTCVGWMNGAVNVANLALPGIAVQPTAITVATNGAGTISVVGSGDGLTYQWRRNGVNLTDGGHVSGSTTANLTIYPATTDDVATPGNGYDVVINGACSPSTNSVRVGLTLGSAADLIWVGDGGANQWDVATTANWNNGGATVFNYGDNVTFDDSSGNTVVNLTSSFLSPGLITVNGSQNYFFGGSGKISGGSSSLLMANGGTLTISNANTYAGGTTISSGTINLQNSAALGSGTITLAGGLLDVPNVQGFTLNNQINVTADSTVRIRNTSTSALVLTNTLGGSAGSLTFLNFTGSRGPTVVLTAPNFTFNRPIVMNLGVSGTNLILQSQNASGSQVFNGVISDTPGVSPFIGANLRRSASGGTTILNAANTYAAGTLLANGRIGVGIDSVSSSPPTIDSGPLGTGPLQIEVGAGTPELFASGGARTVANPILFTANTVGPAWVISGTNDLTLSGAFDLSGTNRTIQVNNSGATILSGVISDGGLGNGLIKTGTNTLILTGINTYTGATTVSNGTLLVNGQIDVGGVTVTGGVLGGSGTILGDVNNQSGGTLSPGNSIGTLTINGTLTLQAGSTVAMQLDASAHTNDAVAGLTSVTYDGTLQLTNLAGTLTNTASFQLFSASSYNGAFASLNPATPGPGQTWNTNNLTVNGTISVVGNPGPPAPTVITNITRLVDGNIQFSFNGTSGQSYRVWASTNLMLTPITSTWTLLSSGSFSGSPVIFTDPNATNFQQRFYIITIP